MSIIRIQGPEERQKGICYEYNSEEMPLGEGGMGYVYKGYLLDERTGSTRMVAIKQMKSDLPEQAIERARREASIRLHNDNLVEMLAFIEMPARMVYGQIQKQYYIVSELLEGVMLDSILEGVVTDRYGRIVPLAQKLLADYQNHPDEFATYIVRNVLAGLLALHNAGYIHRDIDPTNIMVTTDGKVKLIDFGIAKKKNALTAHDKSFTVAGTFMGKAEYASPELALGDIASQDDTTDIYAVGILLFQCITGHTPFSGDIHSILEKQLHSKLPLKEIKDSHLRAIIDKATQKKRPQRYQSAAEFIVALEHQADGRSNGSSKLPVIVGAAVAAVIIAVGLIFLLPKEEHTTPIAPVTTAEEPKPDEVQTALNQLDSPNAITAKEGLAQLEKLTNEGNAEATYELSRLWFKSVANGDQGKASYKQNEERRVRIGLDPDNKKAHDLLRKAVELAPQNYNYLFELANDYLGGEQRLGRIVIGPDDDIAEYRLDMYKAERLLKQAKSYAEAVAAEAKNDKETRDAANSMAERITETLNRNF